MSKSARQRWADVYTSTVPGHARLIVTMLDTLGLQAKLERKKPRGSRTTVPHVRVVHSQAEQARAILAERRLDV